MWCLPFGAWPRPPLVSSLLGSPLYSARGVLNAHGVSRVSRSSSLRFVGFAAEGGWARRPQPRKRGEGDACVEGRGGWRASAESGRPACRSSRLVAVRGRLTGWPRIPQILQDIWALEVPRPPPHCAPWAGCPAGDQAGSHIPKHGLQERNVDSEVHRAPINPPLSSFLCLCMFRDRKDVQCPHAFPGAGGRVGTGVCRWPEWREVVAGCVLGTAVHSERPCPRERPETALPLLWAPHPAQSQTAQKGHQPALKPSGLTKGCLEPWYASRE